MLGWVHTRMSDRAIRFILKPVVFAASLVPVLYWPWAASMHQLNVNPFNAIVRDTGLWSLRFLCLTVALTPLRRLTGWHAFVKFRRMIGLFAFFYAAIHFAAYIAFDSLSEQMSLTLRAMAADAPRPFFAIGYLSLVLMVPLAATSTAGMIRRLGGPRWRGVHRLESIQPRSPASSTCTGHGRRRICRVTQSCSRRSWRYGSTSTRPRARQSGNAALK